MEQLLVLLAVLESGLDQKVHKLHPRVGDLFLVKHFLSFKSEQLGVLLAIDVDDRVV